MRRRMKKKIAALLCAAALAFSMPTAAFAVDLTSEGSGVFSGTVKGANGTANVTLTLSEKGAEQCTGLTVDDIAPNTGLFNIKGYHVVASQGFKLTPKMEDPNFGLTNESLVVSFEFSSKLVSQLPASISEKDLAVGAWFDHEPGVESFEPAIASTSIDVKVSRPFGILSIAFFAKDSDKPSTSSGVGESDDDPFIDGMPRWSVSGNYGITAWGDLGGVNLPKGADVDIDAKELYSGAAYNALRAAIGNGQLLGVFDVDLSVNGANVHDGFGELHLGFTVGYGYENQTVTVWHCHNDGSLTSESVVVKDAKANIVVSDLSEFAIELGAASNTSSDGSVDSSTTSPKTSQSISSAAPVASLVVTLVLGGITLFVRRKTVR